MIKINVQDEKTLSLNRKIAEIKNALRNRSYSERHPELGKMVNCATCGRRGRAVEHLKCEQQFATHDSQGNPYFEDERPLEAPLTDQFGAVNKGALYGRKSYAGRRILRHLKPKVLEVNYLANKWYAQELEASEITKSWQPDITRWIRLAMQVVLGRIKAKKDKARRQADISRRINRGLAHPGRRA